MTRGHKAIGTLRYLETFAIAVQCCAITARKILRQPKVVPDIELQGARGNIARVWLAVRFHFIRLSFDESCSFLQVSYCGIKLAQSDVAMTSMAVKPGVAGKFPDARAVNFDRLREATKISEAASQPNRCFGIIWFSFITTARLG